MALTDAEIDRIRAELGYHILEPGAAPYIYDRSLFAQVIQPNVEEGPSTTSVTAVTAATTPTPVALTLGDATGFVTGDQVAIDVDSRRELPTIQSVSGAAITVMLSLTHSGTYPVVSATAGAFIVREILRKIATAKRAMTGDGVGGLSGDLLASLISGSGGLKKVDEIEFFPGTTAYTSSGGSSKGGAQFANAKAQLAYWRNELAAALGVENMWAVMGTAGSQLEAY